MMKCFLRCALWLAAALVCAGALQLDSIAQRRHTGADIEFLTTDPKPALSSVDALRDAIAADEDSPNGLVSAYTERRDEQVETEDGTASSKVDALYIDGYAPLAFSPPILFGELPNFGRELCCAIDRGTAATLFGSTNVVGQVVLVDGREYAVCAVFELENRWPYWGADPGRGLVMCPASALADDAKIDGYAFQTAPIGKTPAEQAQAWFAGAGQETPALSAELPLTWASHALWLSALRLLLALMIGWEAVRLARVRLRSGVSAGSVAFGTLAITCAAWAIYLIRPQLSVPPAFLPTRWSDLGFWERLLKSLAQDRAGLLQAGLPRPALLRHQLQGFIAPLGCGSLIALILAWRQLRRAVLDNNNH